MNLKSFFEKLNKYYNVLLAIVTIVSSICIFLLIVFAYQVMLHDKLTMSIDITTKVVMTMLFVCDVIMYNKTCMFKKIVLIFVFQIIACLGIAKFMHLLYYLALNDICSIIGKILL